MSEKKQDQKIPVKPDTGSNQKRSDGGLGVDYVRNHREIGNGKNMPNDNKKR